MTIEKAVHVICDIAEFSQKYGSQDMDTALDMAITSLKADYRREQIAQEHSNGDKYV